MVGSAVTAVSLHLVIHIVLLAYFDGERQRLRRIGVAFSLALYPAIVLALAVSVDAIVVWYPLCAAAAVGDAPLCAAPQAMNKWWDDKWRVTRFVVVSLTASQVMPCGTVASSLHTHSSPPSLALQFLGRGREGGGGRGREGVACRVA